jgi:hypothetical protein
LLALLIAEEIVAKGVYHDIPHGAGDESVYSAIVAGEPFQPHRAAAVRAQGFEVDGEIDDGVAVASKRLRRSGGPGGARRSGVVADALSLSALDDLAEPDHRPDIDDDAAISEEEDRAVNLALPAH